MSAVEWETTDGHDIGHVIDVGQVDPDLEALLDAVQRRMKIRDGVPVCPVCHELMEAPSGRFKTVSHVHDGFTITRSIKPPSEAGGNES